MTGLNLLSGLIKKAKRAFSNFLSLKIEEEIRRQKRYLPETSTAKKSIKKEIVLTKLAINF